MFVSFHFPRTLPFRDLPPPSSLAVPSFRPFFLFSFFKRNFDLCDFSADENRDAFNQVKAEEWNL